MKQFSVIGKSVPKLDALEKVTGQAKYTTDLYLPHMLYGKILRSPHAHAKVVSIDTAKAKKLPGVRAIATGKDAPDEKLYALRDRYVIARDTVRFVGEPVAAVAADTAEIAEEALNLIDVEYEVLPAVFDPEEALKRNPDVVVNPGITKYFSPFYQGRDPAKAAVNAVAKERPNVNSYYRARKGDVKKGFAESDLIVEGRYVRNRVQHCCLEPNATVVQPEPDGGLTVWATSQTIYTEREDICRVFNIPVAKVRMIGLWMGGGFGSRVEGLGVSIHITVLLALLAKRPVKLVYTRDEVFIDGITEIPMVIYIKDGVKKDGTLVVREMKVVMNGGAYSGNNVVGAYNGSFASGGTYRIPNFFIDTYMVATNEPVSGPFRGFAANPPEWAVEAHMDLVAEKLRMDPLELRRKNVLKEGDENGIGEITRNIQIENSINKVIKDIEWGKKPKNEPGPWKKGKGLALSNKLTAASNFASTAAVKVYHDGIIEVRHSARDLGQGCNTAMAQIAAEEFAVPMEKVKVLSCDTAITPPDHGTISNRVTFHTGNAVRVACADAKRQIFERVSAILCMPPENLVMEDGLIHKKGTKEIAVRIGDLFARPGTYLPKDGELIGRGTYVCPVIPVDQETGLSKKVVAYYSWGACAVEVAVNTDTGEVKVLKIAQCFDMGQSINPKICEQQTEGGIGMGIGLALYEKMAMENGIVLNPNFVDYKLPSVMEVPTSNLKAMVADIVPFEDGPFGAKGFCEGGQIPTPPAITNAIADAIGIRLTELPMSREVVLKALEEKKKK